MEDTDNISLNQYEFRSATQADAEQLRALFDSCFGHRAANEGALNPIEGRYKVAVYQGEIVACSGILPKVKSDYTGYEITWTCTKLGHRHNGLIRHILELCEASLTSNANIYCSCWHLSHKEYANLHNCLTSLGYRRVISEHKKFDSDYNKVCQACIYGPNNDIFEFTGCTCCEDLYMKQRS